MNCSWEGSRSLPRRLLKDEQKRTELFAEQYKMVAGQEIIMAKAEQD